MITIKKWLKYLVLLLLGLFFIGIAVTTPVWPSNAKLCQDLEPYIPKDECARLDSRIMILKRAFPNEKTSSSDVKSALGAYLHTEYPTSYGHLEEYYISIRPIDYLFRDFDSYRFGYDNDGMLVAFSYDD